MPHKIRVAVIGEGENLTRLIRAILEKQVIPANNMFISAKNQTAKEAAAGYDVVLCEDEAAAVVKSEIVLVPASKREMGTVLAPVSQCTRTRTVVPVCDDPRVNADFILERVQFGTEVVSATLSRDENGKLSVQFDASRSARIFLHQPCRDLVNALID